MARQRTDVDKGPFTRVDDVVQFTKEWEAARRRVLRGLWKKGKGERDGSSSGKTYSDRKRVP